MGDLLESVILSEDIFILMNGQYQFPFLSLIILKERKQEDESI